MIAGSAIGDDGPRVSQTRDVAGFARVDNEGSADLRLHAGEPQRVRVLAGEKVIDDVRTEVRDGTLHVTFDHHGFGGRDVAEDATVPRLSGVRASGSGDVEADGLDARDAQVTISGSGDAVVRRQTVPARRRLGRGPARGVTP